MSRTVRHVVYGSLLIFMVTVLSYSLIPYFSYEELKQVIIENRALGAVLLGIVMCITTIVAPLTSLPLVPMLAPFLGPFTTGLAAFLGWTVGSFVAFWIARRYGRPVVSKFVNLEGIEKYEKYLKPETSFLLLVILRMVIPVDVLSYALGMFTTVSFFKYAIATIIGIVWFSFIFAYMGYAFVDHNYVLFTGISVASVLILYGAWSYMRRLRR